jgi:hypothetical protein
MADNVGGDAAARCFALLKKIQIEECQPSPIYIK